MYNAYNYIVANEGVDSQASYSYKARVKQKLYTHTPGPMK